jgi:S1-C subfamily serine protease
VGHHRTKSVIAAAWVVATFATAQTAPKLPEFDRRTPIVIAVENVGPAVVNVRARSTCSAARRCRADSSPRPKRSKRRRTVAVPPRAPWGRESVVHPDGYVLTNDHVIDGAQRITLQMKSVAGGATLEAEVVNSNVDNDLALLRITGAPGPFPWAVLGDSDAAFVGETVLALGNPLGLASTVTSGILSAKNREVAFEGKPVFKDFLQIDSPIYPGSSGARCSTSMDG